MQIIVALLIALALGAGVSFSANDALPGDGLYAVKVGVNERLREAFAADDAARARVHAELAGRRLDESETVAAGATLRAEIAADGGNIEDRVFHGGSDDTNKLLRAGYRLFRTDRSSMTVKEHGGSGWKKHSGPFDTIKAMDEELKTILQDEKHLRG